MKALLLPGGAGLACLVGCATPSMEFTPRSTLRAEEGLVCGQIKVRRDGQEATWSASAFASEGMQVYAIPVEGGPLHRYQLRGQGRFCWQLPPGRYVIAGFERVRGLQTMSGRIWAEFSVPAPGSRNCVGVLVVAFHGDRYRCHVLPECGATVAEWSVNAKPGEAHWDERIMILEPLK